MWIGELFDCFLCNCYFKWFSKNCFPSFFARQSLDLISNLHETFGIKRGLDVSNNQPRLLETFLVFSYAVNIKASTENITKRFSYLIIIVVNEIEPKHAF